MRSTACFLIALMAALGALLVPRAVVAASWGSSYGDPFGFCPAQSFLPSTYTSIVTNDPSVPNNPEQDTFWGIHANPGYDDWYGYWYGDFAGAPGGSSGWHFIGTSHYGSPPLHWNFTDYGWQVHGHAKQYIAYYNPTFGGECGWGWYGAPGPAPYMADVYGNPVVDIYVDSVPPLAPAPRAVALTTSSITFTWDPVTDQADGAGPDAWASGMDHYDSWITVGGAIQQSASTPWPRTLTAAGLSGGQAACVNVRAVDRLGNATAVQQACATVIGPPPMPPPPPAPSIGVNPPGRGLAGLDSWYWLAPRPSTVTSTTTFDGRQYRLQQSPRDVAWDYGDGAGAGVAMPDGAGSAYPERSPVRHQYERQNAAGVVGATITWAVSWSVLSGGAWLGPYSLGLQSQAVGPAAYPVIQAQSELTR